MERYDIEQVREMLDELLDRAEAGETIGIERDGRLVARLIQPNLPML